MSQYHLERRAIRPDEYQQLRQTTDWSLVSDDQLSRALKNDLFSICVMHEKSIVGMGRVIGDDGLYFYIQDVIVTPDHQGRGLGETIMEAIEEYLRKHAPSGSFIGLMAAQDTIDFYRRFNYEPRPTCRPGMSKSI